MSAHLIESLLLRGVAAGFRGLSWRASLSAGAWLGDRVREAGVRRRVAEDNLARVIPAWSEQERALILRDHYREVGRIAAEYSRLPELVHSTPGEVVAEVRGREHLEAGLAMGRGVLLMTGHFGNFELLGAWLGRSYPVDFVVKPLSNPYSERWLAARRSACGVGSLSTHGSLKRVFLALRAGHCVAILADQDARRAGVFVPFMGRPASTPVGPARLALATGAPIIMGFQVRLPDGRHVLELEPPYLAGADDDGAVERVTAWHTSRLEYWVRRVPHQWFWLHRRWKTTPPVAASAPGDATAVTTATAAIHPAQETH